MFKRFHLSASVAALALLAGMSAAQADEATDGGFTAGSVLVHARALGVLTQVSNDARSPLANVVGGKVGVSDNYVPELDASYFFTPNIAVEAIAGVTYHDVKLKNSNLASIGLSTVPLGSVRLLPPTITAQYHFLPKSDFNPYVGAGVNYTFFYDQHSGPVSVSTHYDDALGGALEAGFNYKISGNWYANVDVKKLFLSTNVHIVTALSPAAVIEKVTLDPWLVGVGIGYRF